MLLVDELCSKGKARCMLAVSSKSMQLVSEPGHCKSLIPRIIPFTSGPQPHLLCDDPASGVNDTVKGWRSIVWRSIVWRSPG